MTQWKTIENLIPYPTAISEMDALVKNLKSGTESDQVWLLQHPPTYTAGTSSQKTDLLDTTRFSVFPTGRGGQLTYHGPGQRIAYVMIDLNRRQKDLRAYVFALEQWIIDTLQQFSIKGLRRKGRIGIWVQTPDGEKKIAALGVRISKWITSHGIALNVHPNLEHFSGIIPCGLKGYGVTSLRTLGLSASLQEVDTALKNCWRQNKFL